MKHYRRFLVAGSIISLTVLGAACSSNQKTNANTAVNTIASNAVQIQGMTFMPSILTVAKGTTVTWTNNDSVSHNVPGDNGGPASGTLVHGATYSYTYTTAGTFSYHCSIHPTMVGKVIVTQ